MKVAAMVSIVISMGSEEADSDWVEAKDESEAARWDWSAECSYAE